MIDNSTGIHIKPETNAVPALTEKKLYFRVMKDNNMKSIIGCTVMQVHYSM